MTSSTIYRCITRCVQRRKKERGMCNISRSVYYTSRPIKNPESLQAVKTRGRMLMILVDGDEEDLAADPAADLMPGGVRLNSTRRRKR